MVPTFTAFHSLLPWGTNAVTGLWMTRVSSTRTHTAAVYSIVTRWTCWKEFQTIILKHMEHEALTCTVTKIRNFEICVNPYVFHSFRHHILVYRYICLNGHHILLHSHSHTCPCSMGHKILVDKLKFKTFLIQFCSRNSNWDVYLYMYSQVKYRTYPDHTVDHTSRLYTYNILSLHHNQLHSYSYRCACILAQTFLLDMGPHIGLPSILIYSYIFLLLDRISRRCHIHKVVYS